jgi:hypothetical protein
MRVLPNIEYFYLFDDDFVFSYRVFLLFDLGLLQRVDVEATDYWVFCIDAILPIVFFTSGRIFSSRLCLRLRLSSIIFGVKRTLKITIF